MEGRIAVFTQIIQGALMAIGVAALVAIAGFCLWFWWPFT